MRILSSWMMIIDCNVTKFQEYFRYLVGNWWMTFYSMFYLTKVDGMSMQSNYYLWKLYLQSKFQEVLPTLALSWQFDICKLFRYCKSWILVKIPTIHIKIKFCHVSIFPIICIISKVGNFAQCTKTLKAFAKIHTAQKYACLQLHLRFLQSFAFGKFFTEPY